MGGQRTVHPPSHTHALPHTLRLALRETKSNAKSYTCLLSLSSGAVAMSLPAASHLLRSALRTQLVPVANLSSKPAKHVISAGEQAIAMTVFFTAILGPSGWVLAHLEDYKNKKD